MILILLKSLFGPLNQCNVYSLLFLNIVTDPCRSCVCQTQTDRHTGKFWGGDNFPEQSMGKFVITFSLGVISQ